MSVAARFWVQSVKKTAASNNEVSREVILAPVIRQGAGGDGNVQWSKYTPSGEIRMVVTNDDAGEWFDGRIGKDVAISFSDPE